MLTCAREKLGAILATSILLTSLGCSGTGQLEAPEDTNLEETQPTAVDVAIAAREVLAKPIEYIGTTQPIQEVAIRSQIEGQLLSLGVDVGDRVSQGQLLAQIDEGVLESAVNQEIAQLAALQSEVARARGEVNNSRTAVETAKVQLQQAQIDAERSQLLYEQGAISRREVELDQTELRTAQQALASAQSQVKVSQSGVEAAQKRVNAQESIIEQAQKRLSYTRLRSPVTGSVLRRTTEPGNLVQPGDEIVRLGDFSRVKVLVRVSELQLSQITTGQSVEVRLDAFPDDTFIGRVDNISPAADATSRQIPVEITLPNPNQRIGSGLLGRVNFNPSNNASVVIPQTALETSREDISGQQGKIFLLSGTEENPTVTARIVHLGERRDGKVEIISGLSLGEEFIARSSRPLENNEPVRLSFLSKTNETGEGR